jgi:predicted glycogen debranching enzyme
MCRRRRNRLRVDQALKSSELPAAQASAGKIHRDPVVRTPDWSQDPSERDGQLLKREWLVTLGNGGYASGTVGGPPTRRHHGLLIAGLPAPYGRTLTLSQLREEISPAGAEPVRLWGQHLAGAKPVLHGARAFECFSLRLGLPEWLYRVHGCLVRRRVLPVYGENSLVVCYEVAEGEAALTLSLRPMVQFRGHDDAVSTPVIDGRWYCHGDGQWEVGAAGAATPLRLKLDAAGISATDDSATADSLYYAIEHERGYDHVGVLWSPGRLVAELSPARPVYLLASTEAWDRLQQLSLRSVAQKEGDRRARLIEASGTSSSPLRRELVLAADQFLIQPAYRAVDRETNDHQAAWERRSVIAGYPWFTDWGRDTMISLPGLTLATGRYQDARRILLTFADYVRDGLIPNLFPEGANVGMYHTADATLWFFQALAAYEAAAGDSEIIATLSPTLTEIIDAHMAGTHYGIGVDAQDGLLRQGEQGVQLTWMDAKVGDWVVTPRRGKAVEINALWYNALRHYQRWMQSLGRGELATEASNAADRAAQAFNDRFWYQDGGYLYDVVDAESGDDASLRPNQLFAISLPNAVLSQSRWAAVINAVSQELATPIGMRSLAPSDPDYQGVYTGDVWARDAAYHQGTVWSWLVGPYLQACEKAGGPPPEVNAQIRDAFDQHLSEACIGQVSEVFDGDPPHIPRGCFAQAWSVAELLRSELLEDQSGFR